MAILHPTEPAWSLPWPARYQPPPPSRSIFPCPIRETRCPCSSLPKRGPRQGARNPETVAQLSKFCLLQSGASPGLYKYADAQPHLPHTYFLWNRWGRGLTYQWFLHILGWRMWSQACKAMPRAASENQYPVVLKSTPGQTHK